MSLVAFIADVHLANHAGHGGATIAGLNERAREIRAVLEAARDRAAQLGAQLMVLGDLFDTTKPLPQIIAAAQAALADDFADRRSVLLMGNHDRNSDHEDDHALGPMVGELVVTHPTVLSVGGAQGIIALPFRSEPAASWIPEAIQTYADSARKVGITPVAVIAHVGMYDRKMADALPWCVSSGDAIDVDVLERALRKARVPAFFAGDWHGYAEWRSEEISSDLVIRMVQVGALVPTGWDNPGIGPYGSLIVLNTQTGEVTREVIPGPRYVNVSSEPELEQLAEAAASEGSFLRVRWKTSAANMLDVPKELPSNVRVLAVHLDRKAAEATAREAAAAATSSATVEEALQRFVEKIELPASTIIGEPELRGRILERASRLLRS